MTIYKAYLMVTTGDSASNRLKSELQKYMQPIPLPLTLSLSSQIAVMYVSLGLTGDEVI